jgi:uncharacterized protein (DUF58 family)
VLANVPQLVPVALLVGALALGRDLFRRRGLLGLEYERLVATRHAVWGDRVPITVTMWNRSWLPAAWVTATDRLSDSATISQASALEPEGGGDHRDHLRELRNAWTLWPFERVERQYLLDADRRGRILFGPVELAAGDLLAGVAARHQQARPEELTIAPRVLPVRSQSPRMRWSTQQRAAAGMPEDPAQFAGVRPYQPGDSPRRIHWRATARTDSPRSKRFDASRELEQLLVLDVQTVPGEAVAGGYVPDLVEALCVVTASLARSAITSGARCGLAVAAYSYRPRSEVRIRPAAGPRQLVTLTDALARLSPYASRPFPQLLAGLPRWTATRVQLVVITARNPVETLPMLRRLRASGYDLRVVGVGPEAAAVALTVASVGVPVSTASLDPDWRTADSLVLAG